MALRAGSKQTFGPIANILTTATLVGFIKQCLGAKAILVRAYNAGNGDVVTMSGAGSLDGVNVCAGYSVSVSGSGVANGAGGCAVIMHFTGSLTAPLTEIAVPFVRLTALVATTPTPVTFDVWPLFEATHPGLPQALDTLPGLP